MTRKDRHWKRTSREDLQIQVHISWKSSLLNSFRFPGIRSGFSTQSRPAFSKYHKTSIQQWIKWNLHFFKASIIQLVTICSNFNFKPFLCPVIFSDGSSLSLKIKPKFLLSWTNQPLPHFLFLKFVTLMICPFPTTPPLSPALRLFPDNPLLPLWTSWSYRINSPGPGQYLFLVFLW